MVKWKGSWMNQVSPPALKGRALQKALAAQMPLRQIDKAILISLKNRFAYLRIPKVANSSIKHLVYRMESFHPKIEIRDNLIHDVHYGPVLRPSMLGFQSPLLRDALFSEDFFRFTFVRNPYAKALSNYLDRYMAKHGTVRRAVNRVALSQSWITDEEQEVSFSIYLRSVALMDPRKMDIHISPQSTQSLSGLVPIDFVGALETIEDDLQTVAKKIWKVDNVDLGFQSPSRTDAGSKLMQAYTLEDLEVVNRLYASDFVTYGYRKVSDPSQFGNANIIFRSGV